MKYFTIDLYDGSAQQISEKEFRARKIGMGRAVTNEPGLATWHGEEETLMRIG
jgi:hypothetical protein